MTTVAFLRAINVSGHSIMKMADLKQTFVDAGCTNVQTYIQSGNVIFDTPGSERARAKLLKNIQVHLDAAFGKHIDIMYRTHADMLRIVKAAPFGAIDAAEDVKLYVIFLAEKPEKKAKLPMIFEEDGFEVLTIRGAEVYVIARPVGKGRYGSANAFLKAPFGITATSRNWNTVNKIIAKMES